MIIVVLANILGTESLLSVSDDSDKN